MPKCCGSVDWHLAPDISLHVYPSNGSRNFLSWFVFGRNCAMTGNLRILLNFGLATPNHVLKASAFIRKQISRATSCWCQPDSLNPSVTANSPFSVHWSANGDKYSVLFWYYHVIIFHSGYVGWDVVLSTGTTVGSSRSREYSKKTLLRVPLQPLETNGGIESKSRWKYCRTAQSWWNATLLVASSYRMQFSDYISTFVLKTACSANSFGER